jgi:4-hydroxybenzoate polyprenyltransferase
MQKIIILPLLQIYGFESGLSSSMLNILVLATILIAAGGYVLNDYFDVKIDRLNQPDKLIIGNLISRNTAMLLHQFLTAAGVVCGLFAAYFAHSYSLALIFIIVPGLLWFYSASYKRQFMIGNIVVAFNAALSILIVAIDQLAFLQKEFGKLIFETPIPTEIYAWIGSFALFAFLTTWIREIIKDMEDEHGDREMECRTMPIKWGRQKTTWFTISLIALTNIALFTFSSFYLPFEGTLTLRYLIFGISLPSLLLIYLLWIAKTQENYHQASTLTKIIMLIGVLYAFIFYFLQAKLHGITMFGIFTIK